MELSFKSIKMELVVPLFAGVLLSLLPCAAIGAAYGYFLKNEAPQITEINNEEKDDFLFFASEKKPDPVLEYYRNPDFKEWVVDFFAGICRSREIAQAILENTDRYNVPPALAFALSWEESRFNPRAINRSNRDGSIDRGLFQLNNRSFPHLEIPVFYEIETNARYGISHLRHCLDSGGSDVSALAMYNAGAGRVRSTGAPHVTLNYASRILENRQRIESRFHSRLIREEEARLDSQF
ncbi:MAG: lytic transglycosylase domain-containing protein [Treponema sp.]|nr:lytic transglycosylase domain-containing protein [Treponema sp.]